MKLWYLSFLIVFLSQCSIVFYRSISVDPQNFHYEKVSKAYFGPHKEEPFPLTVRRGVNIYGRTSKDGRFLFFASDVGGNMDILFRDLKTSVVVPVTKHPSGDTKPAVHPSGKKIAFVSERFDSEGDILIMDIDPEEWLEQYLKGNRLALGQKFICPTNPNYRNPEKVERHIDTDPAWSPDGRYLAFVTNRFNKNQTNIALIDTMDNYKIIPLTDKGGASPTFTPDGKSIYYVSYKDEKAGEIYRIDLQTKEEARITNDLFIDLSPTLSEDGKFLVYTSIRKDSNDNGQLGLRDHSYIIRINLETGRRVALSAGNISIFDTYYSSFNGGSILFSASLNNSLNVYFMPFDGEIPRQPSIQLQYEFAERYKDRKVEFHELAYNALYLYFEKDPLYPLYKSRSDRQLVREYEQEGNYKKAEEILKEMLSQKDDPLYGFSYALAKTHIDQKKGKNPIPELIQYYESYKNRKDVHPQLAPSLLYWIGELYSKQLKSKQAQEIYQAILTTYPDFYRTLELKRFVAEIQFEQDRSKIPSLYLEILGQYGVTGEDNRFIIEDLHSHFLEISEPNRRLSYLQNMLDRQPEIKSNPYLYALVEYTKAETIAEQDNFKESIEILEAIVKRLKSGSYMYLKSEILLVNNLEKMNRIDEAQKRMMDFIEAYNFESGYQFSQEELEESLNSFEVKAKTLEAEGEYESAAIAYSQNNDLLALAIKKKIPAKRIISKYSSFYHKKFIDFGFLFSDRSEKTKESSLLRKVNIVKNLDLLGKSTETLAWIFRWEYFRYFGDFRDLQYLNAVDSSGLSLLEDYYEKNIEQAKENIDLGAVYGYAYFLVNWATKEEQYYIQENVLTEARKKSILRRLRQAEYELMWTIYADPSYIDAYMLLGWLYQYIDVRKETWTFPEGKPDGEVFYSQYLKSFPRKYLEENIDIYTQVLDYMGKKINPKNLSDVHLNLANNYFLLNNYQKALTHYEEVEKQNEKILNHTRFESYRQEAVYYFNYARALVYNGKVTDALPMLEKSLNLYYKNEYYPIVSLLGTKDDKVLKKALDESRKKIALLHALIGLTQQELEDYKNAILSFTTAISMNADVDYINNISLFNSLAICYQKIGDYKKSEISLSLATNEYHEKKSLLDYFDYSIWNTFLPDENRVIGEGRFVSEFPLEFSNLLTQGIRIQNNKDKKEFAETSNLINKRTSFIKSKNLKSYVMGQKILDQTLGDLGYNQFLRGNFKEAEKLYKEHYKILEKAGKDREAFASFFRSAISLFSHIEQNSEQVKYLEEELLEELDYLNKIYTKEIKQCLPKKEEEIVLEKVTACEQRFRKDYLDYDIVLGYIYFYLGEVAQNQEDSEKAFEYYGKALGLLKNPIGIPDTEIGLASDAYTKKERSRLFIAQAIIHHRMGENEVFHKRIKEAYNYSIEYNFERELLGVFLLQAELEFKKAGKATDYKNILVLLNRAEDILRTSPGLFLEIDEVFLNYLFSLKSNCFVMLKQPLELRKNREKLYSSIFFRQLLVNEIRFQDARLFKTINDIQYHVQEDKEYSEKIQRIMQDRKNPTSILKMRNENYAKLTAKVKHFQAMAESGVDILSWFNKPIEINPQLDPTEAIIEIYSTGNQYLLSIYENGQSKTLTFEVKDKNNLDEMSTAFQEILDKRNHISKLVLIPTPLMHSLNFNKLPFKEKLLNDYFEIRYLFRFSQLEREKNTGFSRLRRVTSIDTRKVREKALIDNIFINPLDLIIQPTIIEEEKLKELNLRLVPSENMVSYLTDTDILEGPTDYSNRKQYIGEKLPGLINMKEVIENQWDIPFLVINNYSRNQDNMLKSGFLYDILQFAGVQSIVLIENTPDAERIRNKLISNIKDANKIIQEENLFLIGERLAPYPENNFIYEKEFRKYTEEGISFERKRNYLEAMKSFLQANSLLPDGRAELQIESEINIARAKTYLFPNKRDYLNYFEGLLANFNPGQPQEEKVLYELLIQCYESDLDLKCEPFFKRYMANKSASENKKKIIEFYKYLRIGKLDYLETNYSEFLKMDSGEDSFLKNIKLARMFSRAFDLDRALEHANIAQTIAKNSLGRIETKIAENKINDIEFEMYFIKGIDSGNLSNSNSLFSLGKSKEWKKYQSRLDNLLENELNYFKKSYIQRIYNSYDKLSNSSEFEATDLGPIFMHKGKSSLFLLKEEDRNFLFHILLLSSIDQTGIELNSQFDLIAQVEEKLGNINRLLWMRLEWAANLYYRGDHPSAKKYFEDFEKDYYHPERKLNKDYLILKYKLSKIYSDIEISSEEELFISENFSDWSQIYNEIEKVNTTEEMLSVFSQFIFDKKKVPRKLLDLAETKEFHDTINYFIGAGLKKNFLEAIFEIVIYKEKLKAFNERTYGRLLTYSDIPEFKIGLSKTWRERLPKDQTLKVMFDYGISSFLLELSNSSYSIQKIFEDNREIKFFILDYLYQMKNGGNHILEAKAIESKYRKVIGFKPKQTTYLFFTSFHFKAPIESQEEDNFYYIFNPELIVKRDYYSSKDDFLPGYKILTHKNPNYSPKWWVKMKKLEEFEYKLISQSGRGNHFSVSMEELVFDEGKILKYGGKTLPSLKESIVRKGPWAITGSLLGDTSLKNDDFFHAMFFLDFQHLGPGIVESIDQKNSHVAFFMRSFLEPKKNVYPFQERFTDAILKLKKDWKEDRYRVGFRPCTNVLIQD